MKDWQKNHPYVEYTTENGISGLVLILTYSVPNLLEAIIGTLLLTGILLQISQYSSDKTGTAKEINVRSLAVVIASFCVLSQDLKYHDLGRNSVYDPYDLFASVTGLVLTFVVIQHFGFMNKLKK